MSGDFILLYGPPGAGKSTVGALLAEALSLPFVDLDARIAARAGRSIPRIFAESGEAAFRQLEAALLRETLAGQPAVVALGGGALLDADSRRLAEAAGRVVLLEADAETLSARLAGDATRPLLAGGGRLAALLAARAAHYAAFGLRVATKGQTPQETAFAVQRALGWFGLRAMGRPYTVRVAGPEAAPHDLPPSFALPPRMALVSDARVGKLYGRAAAAAWEAAGVRVLLSTFRTGERSKTLRTAQRLWAAFLEGGLERSDLVLGLGGGVSTDLAGFAAAAYLRGVDWAALPTSLLGMVDASIGGKTGVDLPQGKNLVGAFHPPRWVWLAPRALQTLPLRQWRSGLAEVVKHGLIGDPRLFALCEGGLDGVRAALDEVLRRAVAVKVQVIEADPYEAGPRQTLNAGHTIGHALEAASGYALTHGEAVAIGLHLEAQLAEALGLAETPDLAARTAAALRGLGLPTRIPPEIEIESALAYLQRDKKRRGGRVRYALPTAIGRAVHGVTVPESLLRRTLERNVATG